MNASKNPEKTRKLLLESAFTAFHRNGYTATSLNDILSTTGLTKGALYHHFPNKQALGLAVLDLIENSILETWLAELAEERDPISCLQSLLRHIGGQIRRNDVVFGCPLNNLAQEMTSRDEVFRERIGEIYNRWRTELAEQLRRGQNEGTVKSTVDPNAVAAFIVAAMTGCRGLAKTTQSVDLLFACGQQLIQYLEFLRA